jgi:hypothetical protein
MSLSGNRVLGYLSMVLLAGSVVFYLGWSIEYGDWNDIGLYSLFIILALFGILGIVLSRIRMGEEPGTS